VNFATDYWSQCSHKTNPSKSLVQDDSLSLLLSHIKKQACTSCSTNRKTSLNDGKGKQISKTQTWINHFLPLNQLNQRQSRVTRYSAVVASKCFVLPIQLPQVDDTSLYTAIASSFDSYLALTPHFQPPFQQFQTCRSNR
jgi:hypothetical protein